MELQTIRDHPSFRTAFATAVAGVALLAVILLLLFVLPYLVLSGI